MTGFTISGLFIYPVKSLAGIAVKKSVVDRYGLAFDRRWMVVDAQGQFLSQRQLPQMALIKQRVLHDELILQAPGQAALSLPLSPSEGERMRVKIWDDDCDAFYCGAEPEAWLSGFLGCECKLVYLPDDRFRSVDPEYAEPEDQTAFSDGFPLLLISEASLEDLNRRLSEPMTMNRFRPNLVIAGCEPYAEDGWSRMEAGGIGFRVVKPCSRCSITTINPETAARGAEPLKTLSSYRRQGNKVMFGQNLLHDAQGQLSVGMQLVVVEASGG